MTPDTFNHDFSTDEDAIEAAYRDQTDEFDLTDDEIEAALWEAQRRKGSL